MRRYPFSAMENLRDLGGYARAGGGEVPFERFLRSDAPVIVTQDEIETLKALGIKTVIDLRGHDELTEYPNALSDVFEYHHVPLISEDFAPQDENSLVELYIAIVKNTDAVARVFRAIAGSPGGVLYHCAVGKDRTGIVSALLLRLAGAYDVDIIADYQISHTYLRGMIERFRSRLEDVPMALWYSNVEYMDAFLSHFDKEYGSVEAYLDKIGLSADEIAALKKKFIQ